MEFTELPLFEKHLYDYLDDDEYGAFQWYLAQHPDSGDVIPAGGGIRKVRWSAKGKGKRGGVRIIYYHYTKNAEIILMLIYDKNEMSDISPEMLKRLRKELPK
jgi:mRNA-degrading endonuclease RelE of RelBE toxin-antitoxin system